MKLYEKVRSFPGAVSLQEFPSDQYPVVRAIGVLQRQYADTSELRDQIDHLRKVTTEGCVRRLLNGLAGELAFGNELLRERITSLSPKLAALRPPITGSKEGERDIQTDGFNCHSRLEALLSGYAHYARATSDSIAFLELLGDADSVRVLEKISEIADRGIWFIELYMEGLTLHMDLARLPVFLPSVGTHGAG